MGCLCRALGEPCSIKRSHRREDEVSSSGRQETDAELLGAARGGDPEALSRLLERHQARIYRYGMKMCRHPEDAQDVLQETLLALARGVGGFRGDGALSTWLYTVARNFCIKKRRQSQFAPQLTSLEALTGDGSLPPDPAWGPDDQLAAKQVEAAIDTLEPPLREVLILRDVEGLTAPEVAEVLSISAQAVKSRLHRARAAVRAQVAPLPDVAPAQAEAPCPDITTLFSQHLEDEISADVCAEMERHLARCPRCRSTCDSLARTLKLCRSSAPLAEVPASVQRAVKTALQDYLRSA